MALPRPREARWRYLGAMLFPMPCFPLLPSRGRNAKYGPYLQIQKYLGPYFAVFTVKKRNTRPQMRIWRLPNSYSTALPGGQSAVEFPLVEGSRILGCPKRAPYTARPFSR